MSIFIFSKIFSPLYGKHFSVSDFHLIHHISLKSALQGLYGLTMKLFFDYFHTSKRCVNIIIFWLESMATRPFFSVLHSHWIEESKRLPKSHPKSSFLCFCCTTHTRTLLRAQIKANQNTKIKWKYAFKLKELINK